MRIFPYPDDWLVCSRSRADELRDSALLLTHVTTQGLTVNDTKSALTPSQRTVFIGIHLDSQLMKATPSQRRVDYVIRLLRH